MNEKREDAVCLTHIGKRENHEDNFVFSGKILPQERQENMANSGITYLLADASSRIQLYAICDGMGGHNAGEIASRICAQMLSEIEGDLQSCRTLEDVIDRVQETIFKINKTIVRSTHMHPELNNMGTTLTLLVIFGSEYATFNIGDSRIYFIDQNSIKQITKDNTEGQRLLDLGLLEKDELKKFAKRKYLNKYIGINTGDLILKADVERSILKPGIFLLCSDGLSDKLSNRILLKVLLQGTSLLEAGKELIWETVSQEGADNTTLILVPVGGKA